MHNPKKPLISIIVAVLNKKKLLATNLESIIAQTYENKELLVIDGGSSDGSVEVIKRFKGNISYWESKPDRGIYHAWNKALQHAKGEWICFLGADDCFKDQDVLKSLIPYLTRASDLEIRVVYGKVIKVDAQKNVVRVETRPWQKFGWLMRHGMAIPHPGLMHHRNLFDDHGLFDETFRIAGDYDLLLRELKDKPALFAADVETTVCQIGGVADSNNLLATQEVARARANCGFKYFSWVWILVYLRAVIRSYYRRAIK